MTFLKKITLALVVAGVCNFSVTPAAFAQVPEETQTKTELRGTRKQLATIIFAGLAGAVLGLSTLSFHGRPQEHLSNIAVGFAIGTIAGTIYTTYKATTAPREFYDYGVMEFEEINPSREFEVQGPQLAYRSPVLSWSF